MKASFVKVSFRAVRTEVRDFVKQMGFDFKHLVEHKNRSKDEITIFAKFK